jgi:protein tyrosine/serine phosphatase
MEETYERSIDEEALQALLTVEPGYIQRCWAALADRSGSIDGYLADALDVTEAKRSRIREKLLA